jgi:hypothetical protein
MATVLNDIEVEEGKGEMRIIDETGDTRLIWDPDNEDEVSNAKRTFKDLTAKGYAAFAVDRKGEAGKRVDSFDAEAGKLILMIPQQRGG